MGNEHSCIKETQIALMAKALEDGKEWHKKNDAALEAILRTLRGFNGNPGLVGVFHTMKKNLLWLWTSICVLGACIGGLAGWIYHAK